MTYPLVDIRRFNRYKKILDMICEKFKQYFHKIRQKMKNKDFMIFQTAVRKYVDMHEKSKSGFFFVFIHRFHKINQKKFWTKNA